MVLLSDVASCQGLVDDLENAGAQVLEVLDDCSLLVQSVVRHAPNLVVVHTRTVVDALFKATQSLAEVSPRPVLVFTQDGDADHIVRATEAGMHAYVIDGYGAQRLRPLMQLAQARFAREQALLEELRDVSTRFEERKAVERAKGILMSARQVSDNDAFHILRTASMHSNQRLGLVAQHIIQSAHFAEGVNRAGQLRMLSQRLVKHWLLRLVGVQVAQHLALQTDSAQRIDANLALLSKNLSQPTFGDLLADVVTDWKALKKALKAAPAPDQLAPLNVLAERLLQDAERLTTSLEGAGSVAPLRMLNMAGRQRMLSQRFAKASLLGVLESGEPQLQHQAEMEAARQAFEQGLAYLNGLPLSTPDIRRTLDSAAHDWQEVLTGADHVRRPAGRDRLLRLEGLAAASESLLDDFETLSGQYERSMQMLMG
ncbi:AmiR/NasT family two-component response regulator [Hydrogenophaga palleronii]|uniref:AmiR/NasT family two-component response regulator n=1 Tax=Hydrogenophaga palleronii TaxID=65655 RepID=A0ABU1WUP6_9BURK|nr:type IV pili methyl-accepting chemotaxis transducer N-terminal domain-containing protein [Hydrogenophaga palleronii]MDR7153027.1 AmiR/NasT family two-component response regulator [Hydrogenophaga palleronii]